VVSSFDGAERIVYIHSIVKGLEPKRFCCPLLFALLLKEFEEIQ